MPPLHLDILPSNQQTLLPFLAPLKYDWYLAGGTALALQIGHRESVDFDFFGDHEFDPVELGETLRSVLPTFQVTQEEKNTLGILINTVKVRFMTYEKKRVAPDVESETLRLASLSDIAAMKLSAIRSRHTQKDYIDLYFLSEQFTVSELCSFFFEKFGHVTTESLLRKYLTYFDDIELADIRMHSDISWETMREKLIERAICL